PIYFILLPTLRPPPRPTLFPYTTLFRSPTAGDDGLTMDGVPFDPRRPVAPPPGGNGNRHRAATSMDDMEREFKRKKERELQQARMAGGGEQLVQQRRVGEKVGRNDLCPCGSGKKYKKCCGA